MRLRSLLKAAAPNQKSQGRTRGGGSGMSRKQHVYTKLEDAWVSSLIPQDVRELLNSKGWNAFGIYEKVRTARTNAKRQENYERKHLEETMGEDFCRECLSTERLGLVWKPTKSFTLCEKCWLKHDKSLKNGHGYEFQPKAAEQKGQRK
jgi:hypothetical protein